MSMKNKFILLTIWCIVSFICSIAGITLMTIVINIPNSVKTFIMLGIVFYNIILYKIYENKCNTTGEITK